MAPPPEQAPSSYLYTEQVCECAAGGTRQRESITRPRDHLAASKSNARKTDRQTDRQVAPGGVCYGRSHMRTREQNSPTRLEPIDALARPSRLQHVRVACALGVAEHARHQVRRDLRPGVLHLPGLVVVELLVVVQEKLLLPSAAQRCSHGADAHALWHTLAV